jgi:uncharacterized membrane protein YhaH (DUF805 family)
VNNSISYLSPVYKNLEEMNWYLEVWRKGLDIHGRASRTEYWMFTLFNFIFVCCAAIMDNVVGTTFGYLPYGFIYLVYMVAVLIPSFTVTIRRLHDVGKSGWMLLLLLIPFIGAVWIFVLTILDSEPGNNRFGPNSKEEGIYSKIY